MKLHELIKSKGLHKKRNRIGRGNATGTGNYSGRGLKGQKARSGHSMKAFFEGGQTSIVQRLPKAKGFTRYYKLVKDYQIVNLGKLNRDERISDAMEITKALLKQLRYISDDKGLVKILGDGDYAKHLTFVDIDAFSKSAQEMVDKPTVVDRPGMSSKVASKTYHKIDKSLKHEARSLKRKAAIAKSEKLKVENLKKIAMKKAAAKPAVKKVETLKVEKKSVEKKVEQVKRVDPVKKEAAKPIKTPEKPVAKKPETKKVIEKKPAKAEKPVAKKPAPKRVAAKPAAKKPAAKKPTKKTK